MPNLPTNDSDSQDNEPSFPGPVPKNWAPEHDTHLAHHWQHLTDSNALASFKHTISHLHRPDDPISTQVHPPILRHPIPPRPPLPPPRRLPPQPLFHRPQQPQPVLPPPLAPASNAAKSHFTCLNRRTDPPPIIFMHLSTKTNAMRSLRVRGPFYRCDAMAGEFLLIRYGSVRRGRRLRREAILGVGSLAPRT